MKSRCFTDRQELAIILSMKHKNLYQQGMVNGWMIAAISAIVMFVIVASLATWAYLAYSEQKTDVAGKMRIAVAEAKKEQADEDYVKFQEDYKNPKLEFVGPAEYGRVSFMYPRTWSVYISRDGGDRGDYQAYLHPVTVPSVNSKDSRYALRLEIINKDYDTVLDSYASLLKKGEIKSSTPEFNGNASTRLDGAFSKELRGSVVLMRVRDKTIRFSTDADTFKPDFQAVLDTVKFVE